LTQKGGARGVVGGGDAASVDELVLLARAQLLVLNGLLEDAGVAEGFVNFSGEKLQILGPLVSTAVIRAGASKSSGH
jgi:hypothetical protein